MMFIVRSDGERPEHASVQIKLTRPAPTAAGKTDHFCVGEADASATLREAGWTIVELHDGYYEDGQGGGIAIWGQGRYWEIRSDPFTIREAVSPSEDSEPAADCEHVEVRRAIFGV